MTISSGPEPSHSSVILGVVRAPDSEIAEIEKNMRRRDITILQKKALDKNFDQVIEWFGEEPSDDPELETIGYAVQAYDAEKTWDELTQEVGTSVCGQAPMEILKEEFPSIVVDEYLIHPEIARSYLDQLRTTLSDGVKKVCEEKPKDPVEFLAKFLTDKAHANL